MRLNEIAYGNFTTKEQKLKWLEMAFTPNTGSSRWRIDSEGLARGHGDFLMESHITELPFKIASIEGDLIVDNCELRNLDNFPEINGRLSIERCFELESLEGIQECYELIIKHCDKIENLSTQILMHIKKAGRLQVECRSVRSAVGFDVDRAPEIGEITLLTNNLTEGGLGFIFVKNLDRLWSYGAVNGPWVRALDILEKYMECPDQLYDCQSELIDHGLEEFAKL